MIDNIDNCYRIENANIYIKYFVIPLIGSQMRCVIYTLFPIYSWASYHQIRDVKYVMRPFIN